MWKNFLKAFGKGVGMTLVASASLLVAAFGLLVIAFPSIWVLYSTWSVKLTFLALISTIVLIIMVVNVIEVLLYAKRNKVALKEAWNVVSVL